MGWIILIVVISLIIIASTSESKIKTNVGKYDSMIKDKFNIPQDISSVDYDLKQTTEEIQSALLGKTPHVEKGFYIWREKDNIVIVGKLNNIEIMKEDYFIKTLDSIEKKYLTINNIEYFHITGQKLTVTKGEGGGSSLGGAMVGSVLAGGTGAVIGSRKKTNISTEVLDQRNTMLIYNNPTTNSVEHIAFPPDAYDLLLKIAPDKELGYIQNRK